MIKNLGQISSVVRCDLDLLRAYNDIACSQLGFHEQIDNIGARTISFTNLNYLQQGDDFEFFRYMPRQLYNEVLDRFIYGLLSEHYDTAELKLLNFGFSYSVPGNKGQEYHYDYDFPTEQLWIPLCDFDDENGTEYIHIEDQDYYISQYSYLKNTFHGQGHFSAPTLNIERPYEIRILNCKKHDLLKVPYYCFHRGTSNRKETLKSFFYINFTFELSQDLKPENYKLFAFTNSDPY